MTTEIEELRAALEQGKIHPHRTTYAELLIKTSEKSRKFSNINFRIQVKDAESKLKMI